MLHRTRARRARFSERSFHRWLARTVAPKARLPLPLGDDVAAIPAGGHRVALLTTDALGEGNHFLPGAPGARVGAAAAAASLSDLAAKGGAPVALLVDLLLPAETPERWAREVVLGAERMVSRFGAHVVGGDTKPARRPLVVGTLLGWGDDRHLAPRFGASPGDALVTTGEVGRGGLAARRLRPGRHISRASANELLDIVPRIAAGRLLAPGAHAMLDTSDGIAESAHLMAAASRVRVVIDAARLPLGKSLAREYARSGTLPSAAFYGGDYELLAAVPPERVGPLRRQLHRTRTPLTEVGRVERGRGAFLEENRRVRSLPRAGWDPFG